MNHRRRHITIAMILVFAVLLSVLSVTIYADNADTPEDGTLNLDRPVTLTIAPGPSTMLGSDHPDRLPAANVVYDIYLVANAEKEEGFESYHYLLAEAFSDIVPAGMDISTYEGLAAMGDDSSQWHQLASKAAEKVFGTAAGISPVRSGVPAGESMSLASGLYLVIAHSAGMTAEEFVRWDESTSPKTLVGTIARSEQYEYTYSPELISLPAAMEAIPNDYPAGTASTHSTSGGQWYYEVSAMLKPSEEIRYGDLVVSKTVDRYNTTVPSTANDPVSFVFHVEWIKKSDSGEVESQGDDYLMLTFSAAGTREAIIEGRIPVGSHVKVTEVYTGAGYVSVGAITIGGINDQDEFVVLPAEDEEAPLTASFTNTNQNELIKGYGILNEYSWAQDGWNVSNTGDSARPAQ